MSGSLTKDCCLPRGQPDASRDVRRSLACKSLLHLSQLRLNFHVNGVVGHGQEPEEEVGGYGQHQPAPGRRERR